MKSLSNFFTIIVVISIAKLIQVTLYTEPAYYKEQKAKFERELAEAEEKKKAAIKADSLAQIQQTEEKSNEIDTDLKEKEVQRTPESSISAADYFQNLKNTYLNPIMAELPEGRSREDVVVRYYKHNEDRDKVYALRALGYYLHEREVEDSKESPSNVLYYGSDVDVRDIQIVAYTLIQNGVPLKAIEPSQYDWKYHSLEIGADSLLEGKTSLKVADIQAFNR